MPANLHAARTCPDCGEVIGVYEPIVIFGGEEGPRRSSLAAEGTSPSPTETLVVHLSCFEGPLRAIGPSSDCRAPRPAKGVAPERITDALSSLIAALLVRVSDRELDLLVALRSCGG